MAKKLNLEIGGQIPWKGFDTEHATNLGTIIWSDWTERDGFTIYESVKKNSIRIPEFFVLTEAEGAIIAIVQIADNDDFDIAWDKLEKAKGK